MFRDYNKLPEDYDSLDAAMKQALKLEYNSFYYPSTSNTFVFSNKTLLEQITKLKEEQKKK